MYRTMGAMSVIMNIASERLRALMDVNPGLPVFCLVDEDAGGRMAEIGDSYVAKYVMDTWEENPYIYGVDSVQATLVAVLANEELDLIWEDSEKMEAAYEALPWQQAIFVVVK